MPAVPVSAWIVIIDHPTIQVETERSAVPRTEGPSS